MENPYDDKPLFEQNEAEHEPIIPPRDPVYAESRDTVYEAHC